MKKFIVNMLLFLSIILLLIFVGLFLPATPRLSKSLFFAEIDKDSLLSNVPSPRIIFIGGSNLSFGLNSRMIKDSLKFNPVNTAIHARIGLEYMMDNTLTKIKSGDIAVVAPEYEQFYDKFAYGGEELLSMIIDVSPSNIMKLRYKQWHNIYNYIPKYSLSKFSPSEYFGFSESNIYSVSSFNEFGDVFTHWKLPKEEIQSTSSLGNIFNYSIISDLKNFEKKLIEKGAVLYVTFPGYQATSFERCELQITKIETALKSNGFNILGNPEKYEIPDEMMFNSIYHLSKRGVDYRTNLLISDLRKILNKAHGGNKGYLQ